jgi:hypothetical protein
MGLKNLHLFFYVIDNKVVTKIDASVVRWERSYIYELAVIVEPSINIKKELK